MEDTLYVIIILSKLIQPEKALFPMEFKLLGNSTVFKLVQFWNA